MCAGRNNVSRTRGRQDGRGGRKVINQSLSLYRGIGKPCSLSRARGFNLRISCSPSTHTHTLTRSPTLSINVPYISFLCTASERLTLARYAQVLPCHSYSKKKKKKKKRKFTTKRETTFVSTSRRGPLKQRQQLSSFCQIDD